MFMNNKLLFIWKLCTNIYIDNNQSITQFNIIRFIIHFIMLTSSFILSGLTSILIIALRNMSKCTISNTTNNRKNNFKSQTIRQVLKYISRTNRLSLEIYIWTQRSFFSKKNTLIQRMRDEINEIYLQFQLLLPHLMW